MYAVVALDPETKLQYLQIEWKDHPDWVANAERLARELWEARYQTNSYTDIIGVGPTTLTISTTIPGLVSNDDTIVMWR